jgi:rhamnulokinase
MKPAAANHYLAIDIGASSGRAVLGTFGGDSQCGCMRAREVYRFRTPLLEIDGRLLWDIEALWGEVRACLTVTMALEPKVRSISIDSWGVDYVPLDADGRPLRRPYSYRDARTKGRMADAARLIGADALYARTGVQFLDINTLPQLLADVADEPETVARTATRLSIADYLLYRLSGVLAAERTMASTTQVFDVQTGRWADDLIRAIGDNPARWPRIVSPGTALGPVLLEHWSSGDNVPTVVASCSHDTAAAVAAVPAAATMGAGAWAYLCLGTWALLGAEVLAPVLTTAARDTGFTNEMGFNGTVRLLKNRMGMWVLEECIREWAALGERPEYETLFAEADAAGPARYTIDVNAPEFAERGGMLAKIEAACCGEGVRVPAARGAIVRLLLDSLVESYASTVLELELLTGKRIAVVHIVGGAVRHPLVNKLLADACGRRVVAGPEEATALGNLLVQAFALGDLPTGLSVRDVARRSTTIVEYTPTL